MIKKLDILTKILIIIIFIFCGFIFFFPEKSIEIDKNALKKIDTINSLIEKIEKEQNLLYSEITTLNHTLDTIDTKINSVKTEKIIIKEKYYEKIKLVDSFSDYELDSFFTKRYGPY
jgi:hypothetical protein